MKTRLDMVSAFDIIPNVAFLDSSMAEHAAVNRRVAGSSPARGAKNWMRPILIIKILLNEKATCNLQNSSGFFVD